MDGTLTTTKNGLAFARGPGDWQWWSNKVVPTLKQKVSDERYVMVIFTNQGGVVASEGLDPSKSYLNFTSRVNQMVASLKSSLETEILVFASPKRPGGKGHRIISSEADHKLMRKPETGMWKKLETYVKEALGENYDLDLQQSFFVGDAAGRDGDFLDSDKRFAESNGVKFDVPEDYFG